MAVEDGSLPSNVGGASNVRNILRRVFSILAKRGWWDMLGMDGFLELFKHHKVPPFANTIFYCVSQHS
jgi:alanyl-tRNA synthetase